MRPTRRGLAVVALAPALAVAGWLLGQPELAVAGAAAAALVVVAVARLAAAPLRLEVSRSARPARLPAGDACRVHLRVRNPGRRRSPVLRLRDSVGRFGTAVVDLAPVPGGATRDAVYAFPTDRRGVHPVGPITVSAEDAFALVERRAELPGRAAVVVLPRTHPLAPLPAARGEEREAAGRPLATGSTVDEELAALRPYVPGDDVRRIHWRTTARTGEPVVRQFDQPWQRRTAVLVDTRPSAHDDGSFERAVSVAASVVRLAMEHGELVRLLTTAGEDSGLVAAPERGDELLDLLAAVGPDGGGSLTAALARLARPPVVPRLVVAGGRLGDGELRGLATATGRVEVRVVVLTAGGGPDGSVATGGAAGGPVAGPGGVRVVRWTGAPGTPGLTEEWAGAVAAAGVAS